MLHIGILEDEIPQQKQMETFLEQYQRENPDFFYEVQFYTTGMELLDKYSVIYDLLFLDIRLPDMLGIEAARRIREKDTNVVIVFVTNLTQYALDGYSVNAYDYILKPLLYDAFRAKLDRIRKVLFHRKTEKWLTLKTRQEVHRVAADAISYIEVVGHTLVFHADERDISLWGTLAQYEEELCNYYFSRCNACYLVNLRYVESIKGNTLYLTNGNELLISKTRRKPFLEELARYKGGSH